MFKISGFKTYYLYTRESHVFQLCIGGGSVLVYYEMIGNRYAYQPVWRSVIESAATGIVTLPCRSSPIRLGVLKRGFGTISTIMATCLKILHEAGSEYMVEP